ncbi:proline iminopeptidase [Thermocatellispora tengchongensis]|uniref:Proline iminopeptidase n=2 Tax=Thermocatellispora tengchongensis TaxID=1073253 RepID=A0A840PDT5_9ACTN|nr:alpha/beta fold hydrolase [Thermocatellispora tengchongensis]MBB5135600.1 proline iminopeptidase [Thermocatellispora tengchongensis]
MRAKVAAGLLIVLAVPAGLGVGLGALWAAAAASGNRYVALAVAAPAPAGVVWWLCRLTLRRVARSRVRRWVPIAVAGVELAVVAVPLAGLLFGGPPYRPIVDGPGTRYWDLPTGSRIAYARTPAQGERRDTPVILVHGGPGAPDAEPSPLAPALATAGFEVYAYHQVGAGLSSRLSDVRGYTIARHVADLDAVRAAIGADRVVLAGESWGGQLIAAYLAAHPDRVARAVVASPGTMWSPAFPDNRKMTEGGLRDQNRALWDHPRLLLGAALIEVAGPRAAHALLPDEAMDGEFESLVGELDMRAGCPGRPLRVPPSGLGFWANVMTTRDALQVADPRPALRRVAVPVLVLRGSCDYLAPEVAREYADVLPNAVFRVIDGSGHAIARDRPGEYRELVTAFLRDR